MARLSQVNIAMTLEFGDVLGGKIQEYVSALPKNVGTGNEWILDYLTFRGPWSFAFTFICGKIWTPVPADDFAGVLSSLGFILMCGKT
jgi:hypothetical protein